MKIVVFGAGALGSFIGGVLSQKYDVTLIGRAAAVNAISKNGLKIFGKTELKAHPKIVSSVDALKTEAVDLIIVTVKSYDTRNIVEDLKKIIKVETRILSLQNGLDNEETLQKQLPKTKIVGGTTCHGITLVSPSEIFHAGTGETIIGELTGKISPDIQQLNEIFNSVGIDTKVSDNIIGELWSKAAINASINPITAITGLKNGFLLKSPALTKILENTCQEVIDVAKASALKLPSQNVIERAKEVARKTAANKSSMLQDIENGKKTEIDSINGAIIKIGEKHGVNTPVNSVLFSIIKALEEKKAIPK